MPIPLNANDPGPAETPRGPAPHQFPVEVEVKGRRELAAALPAWDLVPPAQLVALRRRGG